MAIYIDEIRTEVQMQGEDAAPAGPSTEADWQRLAQLRRLPTQLLVDETRTRACGNED